MGPLTLSALVKSSNSIPACVGRREPTLRLIGLRPILKVEKTIHPNSHALMSLF